MADRLRLPGWPRAMPKRLAAKYIGLSLHMFETRVIPEVASIEMTDRVHVWDRRDLDAWVDRSLGRVSVSGDANPWDEVV